MLMNTKKVSWVTHVYDNTDPRAPIWKGTFPMMTPAEWIQFKHHFDPNYERDWIRVDIPESV